MTIAMRVPFNVGPTGRIGRAENEYDVANQYIKSILLTRFGERLMRPGYGARVRDNVFEAIGEVMIQELENDITDAIDSWEPVVNVQQIHIEDSGSTLEVDVQYTLGSTLGGAPAHVQVSIDVGGTVEES